MKKATRPEEQSRHNAPRDFTTTGDPVRAFASTIARETGATVDPIGDEKLHRFDCPEVKRDNRACWYVLYLDRWLAGRVRV